MQISHLEKGSRIDLSNKSNGDKHIKSLSDMSVKEVADALSKDPAEDLLKACAYDEREGIRRLLERHCKHQQAQAFEQARIQGLLREEKMLWEQGFLLVAGVDEAGRGPLAGPVAAGACILPVQFDLPGLNDSKKLTEGKREKLFGQIQKQALAFAIGSAEPAEIDLYNILQASKLAMKRAVEGLKIRPHHLLIDAVSLPLVNIPQKAIIRGDSLSASIAAASILAKVTRDHWMRDLHTLYPEYGFDKNKGYGTNEHLQVLRRLGPSPIHRRSFAPVGREVAEN